MGEVVAVPGITEEELRAAAIDRVLARVHIMPVLAAHEFTITDFRERVKATDRDISESAARRELGQLMDAGMMKRADRYDERVGRVVKAYWFVEDRCD